MRIGSAFLIATFATFAWADNAAFLDRVTRAPWWLLDPGGGGGIPAMTPGSYSLDSTSQTYSNPAPVIVLGSDVGGIRFSRNGGASFFRLNKGLEYLRANRANIQAIALAPTVQGQASAILATTTGGTLLTGNLNPNDPWRFRWTQKDFQWTETQALGALRFSRDGTFALAAPGNSNAAHRGELTDDATIHSLSGRMAVYADYTADRNSPQFLTFDLAATCGLAPDARLLITDVAQPLFGPLPDENSSTFYLSSAQGHLLKLSLEDGRTRASCVDLSLLPGLSGHRLFGLAFSKNPQNPESSSSDLVLLARNRDGNRTFILRTSNFMTLGQFQDITGNFASYLSRPEYQPTLLQRSANNPAQIFLAGATPEQSKTGVICTFNSTATSASWEFCLQEGVHTQSNGWKRFPSQHSSGAGATSFALLEDASGVQTLFFAGLQGFLYRGDLKPAHRSGDRFAFRQIYTSLLPIAGRYQGTGLSLMVGGDVFTEPGVSSRFHLIYDDNILFTHHVNASGLSEGFSHPIENWAGGRTMAFRSGNAYLGVSFGGVRHASTGGIYRRQGESWSSVIWAGGPYRLMGLPNSPVRSLTSTGPLLLAGTGSEGIYVSESDGYFGKLRSPLTEVLSVVAADGKLFALGSGRVEMSMPSAWRRSDVESAPFATILTFAPGETGIRLRKSEQGLAVVTNKRLFLAPLSNPTQWRIVPLPLVPPQDWPTDVGFCRPPGGTEVTILATRASGLWASTVEGTWSRASARGLGGFASFTGISIDADCSRAFATARGSGGVYQLGIAPLTP